MATLIGTLETFTPDTLAESGEVNSNFTDTKTAYNTHAEATNNEHGVTTGIGEKTRTEVFTASGTWTKPTNVSQVYVLVVAGGGGGGGGSSNEGVTNSAGGGGGGGGEVKTGFVTVTTDVTVTIGAGGAGGAAAADGVDGVDSSFGALMVASGGKKGIKGASLNPGDGGRGGGSCYGYTDGEAGILVTVANTESRAGGLPTYNIGGTTHVGDGVGAGGRSPGGGGGGSFGAGGDGAAADAATPILIGSPGTLGGGGGGGGSQDPTGGAGGAGGDGKIVVYYN